MSKALHQQPSSAFTLGLLGLLGGALASCSKPGPSPEREPVASTSSASPAPSAAPSAGTASAASATTKKSLLPMLAPEPFEGTKGMSVTFYAIPGALIVVDGLRVGRIVDEKVEWLGSIPDTNQALGGSQINGVYGSWTDGVDVLYSSNNGRASQPTIHPLTGKGTAVTFAPGGGLGWYSGSARLGKTTVVGGYDMGTGPQILTTRGPGLVIKPITAEKGGCKEGEGRTGWTGTAPIAVAFSALAATEKGTLVTIGNLCERDKSPTAEVWDQPGKSRLIDLSPWVKAVGYFPLLLVGKGDDLWLATDPVLHYSDGKFEPLPRLDKTLGNFFVSPAGKLHALAGRTIQRFDEGKWTPIANLPWVMRFSTITMDEQGTIWVSHNGVSRLRAQTGLDIETDCKTPFVYLYDVSWKNDAKYTYPTTRKALATFPELADISLVEYWEGRRSLGVQVKSKAQGEAVVAHVMANMKDEHPELVCYTASKARVIEMKADAKP